MFPFTQVEYKYTEGDVPGSTQDLLDILSDRMDCVCDAENIDTTHFGRVGVDGEMDRVFVYARGRVAAAIHRLLRDGEAEIL